MYRGLRCLATRRKQDRYKGNCCCGARPKSRSKLTEDEYGQKRGGTNAWEHAQRTIRSGIRKFLWANLLDIDFSVEIHGSYAPIAREQMKPSDGHGIAIHGNQGTIRITASDRTLFEIFQKIDLCTCVQQGLKEVMGNSISPFQDDDFPSFDIMIEPRLLGGNPPAYTL